jgi:hypothetical protein
VDEEKKAVEPAGAAGDSTPAPVGKRPERAATKPFPPIDPARLEAAARSLEVDPAALGPELEQREFPTDIMRGALIACSLELRAHLGLPTMDPQEAMRQLGLPWEQVQQALPVFKARVAALARRPGRPRKTTDDRMAHPGTEAVLFAVRDYIMGHPCCVRSAPGRRRKTYTPDFRAFVLGLLGPGGPGHGMTGAQAECTTGVPANTLAHWRTEARPD